MAKKSTETSRIGLNVKNRLLKRLQKHISDRNFALNQDISQQDWIAKAIEEKLKKEKELGQPDKNSLKLAHISIHIAKEINRLLQERLAEVKNDRQKSYSKKSWVIEAIEEKLEQEESGK